jgi:hypothetical protein
MPDPSDEDDPWLTGPQAAELAGVSAATWRYYRRRRRPLVPPPDDPDDQDGRPPARRRPRWRTSTVERFKATRLRQGTRTDLREGQP